MMGRILFIIGNGFDLYLDIKSSYSDFHNFMIRQWPDGINLSNMLENIFPALNEKGESLLWSDFEEALGYMDIECALDYCKLGFNIEDYDNLYHFVYVIEDSPGTFLSPFLYELETCFHAWVDSLAIYGGNYAIPYFERDALYFSFNYTETLESIFKVPERNICHIHGKRHFKEKLIYGHNKVVDLSLGDSSADDNALVKIEDIFRNLRKDTNKQIHNNQWFFDRLNDSSIDKVIVYGCSLGEIDFPYFYKINNNILNTTEWHFSIYKKPDDVNAVRAIINKLNLDENLCYTFDFN